MASEELREEQIEYIFKDSAKFKNPNDVVFVMGDFNSFYPDELNDKDNRSRILGENLLRNWKRGFLHLFTFQTPTLFYFK